MAELEQAGDGPAGRDRHAEDFGADQDHDAQDGDQVAPVGAFRLGQGCLLRCLRQDYPKRALGCKVSPQISFCRAPAFESPCPKPPSSPPPPSRRRIGSRPRPARRSWPAGGNAVEAMVAMAATIAVVYPHMNGLGGDGFWLVREPRRPRPRLRCLRSGRRARDDPALPGQGLRRHPAARRRCGADGRRGRGRLAASPSNSPGRSAGSCRCDVLLARCDPPRARRLRRSRPARRARCRRRPRCLTRRRALPRLSFGGQAAGGRRRRAGTRALADTLDSSPHAGLDGFLSRRCRPRDRRRSRADRQPGRRAGTSRPTAPGVVQPLSVRLADADRLQPAAADARAWPRS